MRRFLLRLLNAFRPEAAEEDLAREVSAHLALLEDDYRRRGLAPDDARVAARRAIGSVAHAQGLHRDSRSFAWLDDLLDGRGRTVLGVMPAAFAQSGMHFPDPQAQFWVPYVPPPPDRRNRLNVAVMGRLAAGVSLPVAEEIVNTAIGRLEQGRFELSRVHDEVVRPVRTALLMLTVAVGFAAVAVALAAIGMYGVLAFVVTHRTREIGIRMALGARSAAVVSLVVRQSAVQIVLGVASGIAGAALLSRYLEGLLFGVTPLDTRTVAAAASGFTPGFACGVIRPRAPRDPRRSVDGAPGGVIQRLS